MNNEGKGEPMVQINGEQVEASKVVGKTLLAYVTEAGYDPVGIVIEKNMEIIHREDFDKLMEMWLRYYILLAADSFNMILVWEQEVWLLISCVRAVNNRQRPTTITEFEFE